jgi:hypothetical protein
MLKEREGERETKLFKVLNCFSDYISMGEGRGRDRTLLEFRSIRVY